MTVDESTPELFTLTFTGSYAYSEGVYQPFSSTESFTQKYQAQSIYMPETITLSSFMPSTLNINVAAFAPSQSYTFDVSATFSIGWAWTQGSMPLDIYGTQAISATDWIASISSTRPTVVNPTLQSLPYGSFGAGDSFSFPCDAWSTSLMGQSVQTRLTPTSADQSFSTQLDVNCVYSSDVPPTFASQQGGPLAATIGTAQQWELPAITLGSSPLRSVTIKGESVTSGLISIVQQGISPNERYFVTYAGGQDTSIVSSTTQVTITLTDEANQYSTYPMTVALNYVAPAPVTPAKPTCALSTSRIASVTTLLASEKLELSLQASKVGTVNVLFGPALDRVETQLALTDLEKTLCGSTLAVKLVTTHTFLTLVEDTQAVLLRGDEKTVPAVYEDATIEIKLGTVATWNLQIKTTFSECTITELAFERRSLSVSYKVGSSEQRTSLPGIKQEPDCGQTFTTMTIKNILSSLAQEQVLTAIILDTAGAPALILQTDDPAFANQKVTFQVELEQDAVSQVVSLKVSISFEVDPPAFDLEGFTAAPLTCGAEVAEWSLLLPQVSNAETDTIELQIVPSEQTQYFVLDGNSVSIQPTLVDKFIAEQCSEDAELSLEMALISSVSGENKQTLSVKIEAPEVQEEQPTNPGGVATNIQTGQNQQGTAGVQIDLNGQNNQFQPPAKIIKPLEVSRLKMSPTGQLTIKFSKPIEIRPLSSFKRKLQANKDEIDVGEAIEVFIEGQKEAEVDKSIVEVKMKKASETAVKIQIHFADIKAISEQISEPDTLVVKFTDPGIIIDKETGKPLSDVSFEKRIEIGAQFTAAEFEEIVKQAETAAQISIAVTIWEIIIIMLFKKVLFSMWVLILTLQFFVYMATWQIRYPGKLHFILYELKRIALGEFMDDLDVGDKVNMIFGLPPNEDSAAEEKVAEERLGSGSMAQNFGVTLLLGTIIFALLLVIILVVIFIAKRANLRDKAKDKVKSLKTKIFWNPMVRYLTLNSLKLSMTAIVVQKAVEKGAGDIASSIGLLVVLNGAPLIFYMALRRNQSTLSEPETIKSIGSIYAGKNVTSEGHCAWLYPMAFFWRRTLFIVITVHLFDWPYMQMLAHQALNVVTIGIMLVDSRAYESRSQKIIEVGSEIFMHLTSISLSQFTVQSLDEPTMLSIERMTLVFFSCLILLNISFIVLVYVQACKEKKRKKMLEQRKKEYLERQELKKQQQQNDTKKESIQLEAIAEDDEEEKDGGDDSASQVLVSVTPKSGRSRKKKVERGRSSARPLISDIEVPRQQMLSSREGQLSPQKTSRVNDLGPLSERSSSSDASYKQVQLVAPAEPQSDDDLAQVDKLIAEVEQIFARNSPRPKQPLTVATTQRDAPYQITLKTLSNNNPQANMQTRRSKKAVNEQFDSFTLGDEQLEPDLENDQN